MAQRLTRRDFIKRSANAAGTLVVGGLWITCGDSSTRLKHPEDPGDPLPVDDNWPLVTPNKDFYLTQVRFPEARSPEDWQLEVRGLVDRPETLTYDDLLGMEAVEETSTLICIGNSVGGRLVGTAKWKGVPLSALLERWGVQDGAVDMIARDWDIYSDSIPVAWLRDNFALLAYEMNGEPLPHEHGRPVRIIVPGLYGIKNIKWLASLEFVDYDYNGYWQQPEHGGWAEEAPVRTAAQIKNVGNGFSTPPGLLTVTGWAFAGLRGVERVEVSSDNGRSWTQAMLEAPISNYTWVRWTVQLDLREPGEHLLRVRATDGEGRLQLERDNDRLSGSEGWHAVSLLVE